MRDGVRPGKRACKDKDKKDMTDVREAVARKLATDVASSALHC